jgi:hypothetical protein
MPFPILLMHLLLCAACGYVTLRVKAGSRVGRIAGCAAFAAIVLGFTIERRAGWAWRSAELFGPSLVFFSNLTAEGAIITSVILWRSAADRAARRRALLLSCGIVSAAALSYRWFFLPVPAGLVGVVDSKGFCRQTSDSSCSAAAAATLLKHKGIPATESEMAQLCTTREGIGTPSLGLYRGLALKATGRRLHATTTFWKDLQDLRGFPTPCIISVGLQSGAPSEVAGRMESYGWEEGRYHAVAVLGVSPDGKALDVADPSYGREKWPIADIEYIWDGYALFLAPDR